MLVVLALPDVQCTVAVELPAEATVADAIDKAGLEARFPQVGITALRVGIWNKACERDTPVREGDRVELYRPVHADARQMRRARVAARPSKPARSGR